MRCAVATEARLDLLTSCQASCLAAWPGWFGLSFVVCHDEVVRQPRTRTASAGLPSASNSNNCFVYAVISVAAAVTVRLFQFVPPFCCCFAGSLSLFNGNDGGQKHSYLYWASSLCVRLRLLYKCERVCVCVCAVSARFTSNWAPTVFVMCAWLLLLLLLLLLTTLVANCRFSRHATINNNATLSNSRCTAYWAWCVCVIFETSQTMLL